MFAGIGVAGDLKKTGRDLECAVLTSKTGHINNPARCDSRWDCWHGAFGGARSETKAGPISTSAPTSLHVPEPTLLTVTTRSMCELPSSQKSPKHWLKWLVKTTVGENHQWNWHHANLSPDL
jgi:hypothetical protein